MVRERIRISQKRASKAAESDPPTERKRVRIRGAETAPASNTAKDPQVHLNKSGEKSKKTGVRAENEKLSEAANEVGYGNPPKHTQFAKNDGRPRPGRPKGRKNIATLVLEATDAQITVTIDGKKRRISKAQAAEIQLANMGAMGDPKLLLKFVDLIAGIEARAEAARPSEYPFSDLDKKVIIETYKRLRPYDEREND